MVKRGHGLTDELLDAVDEYAERLAIMSDAVPPAELKAAVFARFAEKWGEPRAKRVRAHLLIIEAER